MQVFNFGGLGRWRDERVIESNKPIYINLTTELAKQIRAVHFGGNWTDSNMRDNLASVSWQQASTKVYNLNSIAALVYHVNYFVRAILQVLDGGPLDAHDKYSFDHPAISSEEDWQKLLDQTWTDAEKAADLIEHMRTVAVSVGIVG